MTRPITDQQLESIRFAVASTFDQTEPAENRQARWENAAWAAGRTIDRNALAVYMAVADAEQQALADDWGRGAATSDAEIRRLKARVADLEGPAVEARAALAALCYDLEDPGSNALGALYLISRVTAGVEAPRDDAAQVLASHEAQIMRRCAEFVRDTYDGEWVDDAAATLERDADITEHGCPGFEAAYQGPIEAERRLGNCKHCGRPHPAAASAPSVVPVGAVQGSGVSESAQSPTGAPEGALGASSLTAPPRRTLTPGEYDAAWHAVEGAAGQEGADPGTVLHAVLDRLGIQWRDAAQPTATTTAR